MSAIRRVMEKFRIGEISGVDRPAQAHARMTIMKRAPDADADEDVVTKAIAAFAKCVEEIHKDETITDKPAEIAKQRGGFVKHLVDQKFDAASVEKAADEITAAVAASAGSAGNRIVKGVTMFDALKKALGLSADASEADITKAVEEKDKKLKEGEKAEKRADAILKMSDKHKAFMDKGKMPSGGKEAFADMDAGERDKHMAANPIDDEEEDTEKAIKKGLAFKAENGMVLRKSDFGSEAGFAFAKAQAAELATTKGTLAKREEESTVASFEKRAIDLGFQPVFGATLRKAYSGDATAQAEVEKQMKALKKQADEGGLFGTFGKNSPRAGSAEEELLAKAAELRKADPKLSPEQAYTRAYKSADNRDIVKRMRDESQA